jgi:hypothetical protein
MLIVTGSPSGSLAPDSVIVRSLWFGGHSDVLLGPTPLQTGGLFVSTTATRSIYAPTPPEGCSGERSRYSIRLVLAVATKSSAALVQLVCAALASGPISRLEGPAETRK